MVGGGGAGGIRSIFHVLNSRKTCPWGQYNGCYKFDACSFCCVGTCSDGGMSFHPNKQCSCSCWMNIDDACCNPEMSQFMMTSSSGNLFRVTGPLCGEFTGHRWIPLIKASGAELLCILYKRLRKQSWGWWFETSSCSVWRHCNFAAR